MRPTRKFAIFSPMLTVLFEDEEILVLDKPAGLATQPGAGIRVSLVEAVERDCGLRPFLVHRLDRETAGCIIVAKSSPAARRWTERIGSRSIGKFYRAVVRGRPSARSGRFTRSLDIRGTVKTAETGWELLASAEIPGSSEEGKNAALPISFLELELGTGRNHQIRRHLAAAGFPILGDDLHGDFRLNKRLRKDYGLRRLLLLSYRLEFPDGRRIVASIPDYFRTFAEAFPGLIPLEPV